jgi:hypothetical protein
MLPWIALLAAGDAAYGTGLLNARLRQSLRDEIDSLLTQEVNVARYQSGVSCRNYIIKYTNAVI